MTPALPAVEYYPLPHRRHAVRQRAKALSHVVPALVLVQAGAAAFSGSEQLSVRLLELVIGTAYLVLLVREWRHLRHPPTGAPPHGPAWLELAAAGILALEGYHIWHRHHEAELAGAPHRVHYLPWLYAVLALVYVGLTFGAGRLARRQGLHFTADGFWLRLRPLGRVQRVHWAALRAITPAASGPDLLLHALGGGAPQVLKLSPYYNAALLHERLLVYAAAHGVPQQLEQ